MHADYTGQGVDQLAQVIDQIKHNPDSRRIIMSAWNPTGAPLHLPSPSQPHRAVHAYVRAYVSSCVRAVV